MASWVGFADSIVGVESANTLALAAVGVPSAKSIAITIGFGVVSELATLAAFSWCRKDAHDGFSSALSVAEEPASLFADGLDGVPHGVVHGIAIAFLLLGEALRRNGDALEARSHRWDGFGKAARTFGSALSGSLERSAVSVAEVESRIPNAESVGEASGLSEGVIAGALAVIGDGVPFAVAALLA